jgi:hypothetical protein
MDACVFFVFAYHPIYHHNLLDLEVLPWAEPQVNGIVICIMAKELTSFVMDPGM